MNTKATLSLLICLLAVGMAKGQQNANDHRRAREQQWLVDLMQTSIGIELGNPKLGNKIHFPQPWMGVNLQLGPLVGGYSQGMLQAEFVRNELISTEVELTDLLPSRSWYLGTNWPLPFLTFGEFRSYKKVFRGHPIVQTTLGGIRFGPRQGTLTAGSSWQFAVTPGYRLRFPYLSVDLGLENRFNFVRDGYAKAAKTFMIGPSVTLRFDGLFDSFTPIFVDVDATQVSVTATGSQSTSSTQYNADGSRTTTTNTTTYYDVQTKPTSVGVADIGTYAGLGLRVARSNIGVSEYSNVGTLIGVNALMRNKYYVLGLNLEGGRVGHASEMQGTDPSTKNKAARRKPHKYTNHTSGSTLAFNTLLDVGLDLNSLLLGVLGGVIMDDHDATSYLSFNAGYSLGYSVITGQRFDDPDDAIPILDRLRDPNRYNDARLNNSGYLGGWFLACDIGHVSFKTQWYRYKRAPLANGMMMSLAYRFVRPRR